MSFVLSLILMSVGRDTTDVSEIESEFQMSGKKAKQARKANPQKIRSAKKCPTMLKTNQLWKSGTFVSGQQVVTDLKAVAKRETFRTELPEVKDDDVTMSYLEDKSYLSKTSADTKALLDLVATELGTSVQGVLAELEANNVFPPGVPKEIWLDKAYAGTWNTEQSSAKGILRNSTDVCTNSENLASTYATLAEISPLNIAKLKNGHVVVSGVRPLDASGRFALRRYVKTGAMGGFFIP